MPTFTTRVELHDVEGSDYDTLHEAMEAQGFSRHVVDGKTGIRRHLLMAEYSISGRFTLVQVRKKAQDAASVTGRSFSVLVTESKGRSWSGLKKV